MSIIRRPSRNARQQRYDSLTTESQGEKAKTLEVFLSKPVTGQQFLERI